MTQTTPGALDTSAINPAAIMLQIADEAGLEPADIAALRHPTKLGDWRVGAPIPRLEEVYVAFAMFVGSQGERSTEDAHVPGELRVYALPRVRYYPKPPGDNTPPEEVPYVCFVLLGAGTANQAVRTDTMASRQTFIEEVAHEFRSVAILADLIDDDGEGECPNCAAAYDDEDDEVRFCANCGHKLPEPGPETQPPPAPVVAPS